MFSSFSKTFKRLDFFSEPITLHLFERKKFQTFSGALLSVLMLLIVFWLSFDKLSDMINKSKFSLVSKDEMQASPMKLNLRNRFALSVTCSGKNLDDPHRFINLYGLEGRMKIGIEGTFQKTKKFHELVPCQDADFPQFSTEKLNKAGVNAWFCFKLTAEDQLSTWGKYGDEDYQYLQISVTKCSNSSRNESDSCAPEDEILSAFKQKMYISLFIVNSIFDFSNYQSPVSYYFDEISYVIDYNGFYIQKEVYFTPIDVRTDQSWLINFSVFSQNENIAQTSDFLYERQIDDFSSTMPYFFQDKLLYTSIYLRSGLTNKIYSRKYVVLQDFLASFGSFLSVFFMGFKVLSSVMHTRELYKSIAEMLYQSEWKSKQRKPSSDFCLMRSLRVWVFYLAGKFFACFFVFKPKNRFLLKFGKNSSVYGPKASLDYYKLIEKAVKKDTDLINILKSLQQLETMKQILLTADQKSLLNYARKPKIWQRDGNITLLESAYSKIINPNNENEINKKIVRILDPGFIKKMEEKKTGSARKLENELK